MPAPAATAVTPPSTTGALAPAATAPTAPTTAAALPAAGAAVAPGVVEVQLNGPARGQLTVDGKRQRKTDKAWTLTLAAGDHVLEVRAAGYLTWQRTVTVTEGDHQMLSITIERKRAPTKEIRPGPLPGPPPDDDPDELIAPTPSSGGRTR